MTKRRSTGLGWLSLASAIAALAVGCGGSESTYEQGLTQGSPNGTAEVSGNVFLADGDVVRGAAVRYDGSAGGREVSTESNTTGAFTLRSVPSRNDGLFVTLVATADVNGVPMVGSTVAQVFNGERAKNVSFTLGPRARSARLQGFVRDLSGFGIAGTRVFARPVTAGAGSSAVTITNDRGAYTLANLTPSIEYRVSTNRLDSDTDTIRITFNDGQTAFQNFSLGDSTLPILAAPTNFDATAWTSPPSTTRSAGRRETLDLAKRLLGKSPARRTVLGRDASDGFPIEVDAEWTYGTPDSHFGFAVLRRRGSTLDAEMLVRDPLAVFFADNERLLVPGTDYTYTVKALATDYPADGSESAESNAVTVRPLDRISSVTWNGTRFDFTSVPGADRYRVYVFTRFPTNNDDLLHDSGALASNSYVYAGPTLTPGRTYYALALAFSDGRNAISVSDVVAFTR